MKPPNDDAWTGGVPPLLHAPQPSDGGPPPAAGLASAPLLVPERVSKAAPLRQVLAFLLSLCLGLFLADAAVSLVDTSLVLFLDVRVLTVVREIVCWISILLTLVVYALMGLTPMIPKRLFLPITLFNPLGMLAAVPIAIYCFSRFPRADWVMSLCQVAVGVGILCWAQGGFKLRWPLVPESRLGARRFSWLNLSGFLLVNFFVFLPAVIVYLAACAALAVDHLTAGFLELRPSGFTVQVRKYVRKDGKTIQLVPMAHIGEAAFYQALSRSFPTNAVVLMEGVTDYRNLLTNQISYKRMATSLGLTEQEKEFNPIRIEMVMADVDVGEFSTNTIGLLNLVMLVHAKGVNAETVRKVMLFTPPPHFEEQLMDDLVSKRNQHLLEELRARLEDSDQIVIPWGVAHMPGIARAVQKAGFRLDETREYTVIRFHTRGKKGKGG